MDRSVQEVIWNLEDLYAHAGDPRLQEDRAECRKESEAFPGPIAAVWHI